MSNTPNLDLERLVEGQASGEITHNIALNKLDSLVMGAIIDRDLTDPPGSPAEGDRYIVATGGENAWDGEDGNLAIYYNGWVFITPSAGWVLWVVDEHIRILYTGAAWEPIFVFKRKDSSDAKYNNTYANDADLFFPVLANDIWVCRAILFIEDNSPAQAAGFKFKWTIPSGADISGFYTQFDAGNKDIEEAYQLAAAGQSLVLPDGAVTILHMDFHIVNGATPGNLQLQWAQVVTDAVEVVVHGVAGLTSYLYAWRAGEGIPPS